MRIHHTSLAPFIAWSLVLLIAGLLRMPAAVYAQPLESRVVTAVGEATVYDDNQVKAIADAEQNALLKAIQKAVGVMITSETVIENYVMLSDKIYSKTSGYVRTYKRIGEPEFISDRVEVRVEAEIAQGDLSKDMEGIAEVLKGLKRPRILISVDEQMQIMDVKDSTVTAVSGNTMASVMTDYLRDHRFDIISATSEGQQVTQEEAQAAALGDTATIRDLVGRYGATVLIVGRATANRSTMRTGIYESIDRLFQIYGAAANARAIRLDTGVLVAQAEPKEANNSHINAKTAATKAIKKAADPIAEDLMRKILVRWQDEYTSGSIIKVIVNNTVFADINDFKWLLENRVLGVRSVSPPEFADGAARYDVQYLGRGNDLAQELSRSNALFEVTIKSAVGNRVGLEIARK